MSSDNVQWIAGFNVNKFANSRFWPVINQVATYVSGNDTWYPYDVACNLIRSADHTRFHLDTSHHMEKEMTFLLYLSPNWTAADYGETAFMEHNYDSPDNDYVAEVVPMYGRAVIFSGNFPHSARPPAPYHAGPRYTFAVKMSFTKWEAVVKTFHEEGRHSMLSTKENIMQIVTNPAMYAAQKKVSVVANYLQTKAVQQALDHASGMRDVNADNEQEMQNRQAMQGGGQPENEENEEGEGEDENDQEEPMGGLSQLSEEDQMLLRTIINDESEIGMNADNTKRILNMAKHYNLDKYQPAEVEHSEDELTPELQQKRILMWQHICKKDADCLSDYLELFLKQQLKLKEIATRDMYAIL
uniref:Prolyl 4-hydroxylase alpha subunit Fe(2+) 2OG dioxygenase domain-containing protein n=1 Tax=Ciona savignyi TaxID=51511 RepID=H2ZAF5_CIOSA